ncbi:MAG: phospholipase D-like domain-containing protein [Nitrospirota bacterium]|nr:phospholipase D-like domain-containing protein [Nitrospirota bacterium]
MNAFITNIHFSRRNIEKIYGTPFTDGNNVTLLWKDKELFHNIFNRIKEAKELICLEFYIFRNDETGNELAEILKQKASEGVKVYILYDHFGSFGTSIKFWKDLKQSGIQIRASHPFKWTAPFHYVHRDHKKFIIIDGNKAFTGGLNIANEYRGYHRFKKKIGWRDTGIFLEGPIAKTLLDTFKKSWEIWKGTPIHFNKNVEPITDGLPVLPIFASSAKGRRKMRKLIYDSISQSQKSIYLTTAYFTPSRRMLQILENAVLRGADVKLLLPGKSDISAAYYAGRAFFSKLLKAGVEIYNYHGEILHAKTSVFDEMWSIIGSANLDFQSLRRNDEGNVGIIDTNFGKQMIEIFHEDLKQSEKITLDKWLKRPFIEKVKEKLFAMFRRRL